MQRTPLRRGPVQGTAMPEMTVKDDHCAGRCQQRCLVRMRCGRVWHLVLRQRAAQMRARHHARWAVLRGEVVEQPDRVAHPKLTSGNGLTPVGVEYLMAL